jgi:putative transcriptional regulator
MYLYTGGPVEPTRAWILTAKGGLDPEALEVMQGVYLSASPTLVRRTLEAAPDAATRMVVGYAGWGAGQLDIELAQGSWLLAPVEPDLIFSTSVDTMWESAIRRLGAEPSMLQGSSGVH